jgi:hypothetical protein
MSSSRAILIGNGKFDLLQIPEPERLDELDSPMKDVDGLERLFSSRDHGKFVVTKKTNGYHYEIAVTMDTSLAAAKEDDTVLVYFSGHAVMSGESLYLAAYQTRRSSAEAYSLPFMTVQNMVATKSVRGRFNVIGILDCCFSGMASNSLPESIVGKGGFSYILAASTKNRPAYGVAGDHSLLTEHIIEGIRTGAADQDLDGWVCMDELCTYVEAELSKTGLQTPQGRALTTNWRDLRLCKTDSKRRREKLRQVFDKLKNFWDARDIDQPLFFECQVLIDPDYRVNTEFEKDKLTLLYDLIDGKLDIRDFKQHWEDIKQEERKSAQAIEEVTRRASQRPESPITRAQLNPAFASKGSPQDRKVEDDR